jgi:hypothetical protein
MAPVAFLQPQGQPRETPNPLSNLSTPPQNPKNFKVDFRKKHGWGVQHKAGIDHTKVFFDLSTPLLSEISLCLHCEQVKKVDFFQDCQPHFLVALVQKLNPKIYLPGDYIALLGQFGREMYFIRTGAVIVLSRDDTVLAQLRDGDSFGEVALYGKTMRRTATIVSSSYCDLDLLLKEG